MLYCFVVSLSLGKALVLAHIEWAWVWGCAGGAIQSHVFCGVNAEIFLIDRWYRTCLMTRRGLVLHLLSTLMDSLVHPFMLYTSWCLLQNIKSFS